MIYVLSSKILLSLLPAIALLFVFACSPEKKIDHDPSLCSDPFSFEDIGEGIRPMAMNSLLRNSATTKANLVFVGGRIWSQDKTNNVHRRLDVQVTPTMPGGHELTISSNCTNIESFSNDEFSGFTVQVPLNIHLENGEMQNVLLLAVQGKARSVGTKGTRLLPPEFSVQSLALMADPEEAGSLDEFQILQTDINSYTLRGGGLVERGDGVETNLVAVSYELQYEVQETPRRKPLTAEMRVKMRAGGARPESIPEGSDPLLPSSGKFPRPRN